MFFNSDPGGPWAIVGIIWLAPIFGIYFALKLAARGQGPKSVGRAVGFAVLGVAVVFAFSFVGSLLHLQQNFRGRLLYLWTGVAVAALVTLPGLVGAVSYACGLRLRSACAGGRGDVLRLLERLGNSLRRRSA